MNRPRSKTFEEYEKETDDIWNDKEEDLDALTHSTELDMLPEGRERQAQGVGTMEGRVRTNPKGKSKGSIE